MGTKGEKTLMTSSVLLLKDALKLNLSCKKAVPVHRLDRATGGLVLCSNSKLSEIILKQCFSHRVVKKRYRALVMGRLISNTPDENEGLITIALSGQDCITKYKIIKHTPSVKYEIITTVDLYPVTGRRHQLRKHMQAIGNVTSLLCENG